MDRQGESNLGLEDFVQLFRSLPTGVVVLDRDARVLLHGDVDALLTDLRPAEVLGKDFFRDIAPCTNVRRIGGRIRQALEDDAADLDEELDFAVNRPQGSRDVRIRMRKLRFAGRPVCVLLIEDNSRLKQTERRLMSALAEAQQRAVRDPLTGLYNRRHFDEVLALEIRRARRVRGPITLLSMDLDGFKTINDRFGHQAGDSVLAAFAGTMTATLRASDLYFRVGGDEFCAILPGTELRSAILAAQRLVQETRVLGWEEFWGLKVTTSLGVATIDFARTLLDATPRTEAVNRMASHLVLSADEALYVAKAQGRDRIVTAQDVDGGKLHAGDSQGLGSLAPVTSWRKNSG
jgi:photoactive yellow protein